MSATIWRHFQKLPNDTYMAKCILCNKEYSYKTSITNLKKHLGHKHVSAYQNFLKSNQNTAAATSENRQEPVVAEQAEGTSSSLPETIHPTDPLQQSQQQRINDEKCKKDTIRHVDVPMDIVKTEDYNSSHYDEADITSFSTSNSNSHGIPDELLSPTNSEEIDNDNFSSTLTQPTSELSKPSDSRGKRKQELRHAEYNSGVTVNSTETSTRMDTIDSFTACIGSLLRGFQDEEQLEVMNNIFQLITNAKLKRKKK